MQDDKKELEKKKKVFREAAGKIARKLRGETGILKCYRDANLPERSISKFEKGVSDLQITTICRLAHAHGMKCSEFIKLVENELPEDFTFRSV
jgi:hypothetical protein